MKRTKEHFDRLDSMIWFLTVNFAKENPDSYLPEEAVIDEGRVYNCSLGELVYDFQDMRLITSVSNRDYSFKVLRERQEQSEGELVYFKFVHENGKSELRRYSEGEWQNEIIKEYRRRKRETTEEEKMKQRLKKK